MEGSKKLEIEMGYKNKKHVGKLICWQNNQIMQGKARNSNSENLKVANLN